MTDACNIQLQQPTILLHTLVKQVNFKLSLHHQQTLSGIFDCWLTDDKVTHTPNSTSKCLMLVYFHSWLNRNNVFQHNSSLLGRFIINQSTYRHENTTTAKQQMFHCWIDYYGPQLLIFCSRISALFSSMAGSPFPTMGGSCIRPACDTAGSTWPQWHRGVMDPKSENETECDKKSSSGVFLIKCRNRHATGKLA